MILTIWSVIVGHRTQAEIKMTWTGGARSELATKLHSDDHRLSEIQKVCEEIKIPFISNYNRYICGDVETKKTHL